MKLNSFSSNSFSTQTREGLAAVKNIETRVAGKAVDLGRVWQLACAPAVRPQVRQDNAPQIPQAAAQVIVQPTRGYSAAIAMS